MGAPQAKESTSRHTAGVSEKPHGSRISEIDQLVRFGELTELCVSASLPPDLTSIGVPDTHKNLKNKRNVTMAWHKSNFKKILCVEHAEPFLHGAQVRRI